MEGVINAISHDRFGIKIGEKWYNAKDKKVQEYFKNLNKGDSIEFDADEKNNLTFVKKKVKEFQKADEIETRVNFDSIMADTLVKVSGMYENEEIVGKELREKLDWTKITITLFITKTKKV